MTNWIKHDSNEPPALAPAAYVKCVDGPNEWVSTVSRVDWCSGIEFHQITDPHGIPYCSAEGLKPGTKYVATEEDGTVLQFEDMTLPSYSQFGGHWGFGGGKQAPSTHRYPGYWRDSMMRVWRGE